MKLRLCSTSGGQQLVGLLFSTRGHDNESSERLHSCLGPGCRPAVLCGRARFRAAQSDIEVWPGARIVEVVPPGSDVGLVLLPPDSQIPMAVRMGTGDADATFGQLRRAEVDLHNEDVLHMEGAPPMFFFSDPDGNGLVYLQED